MKKLLLILLCVPMFGFGQTKLDLLIFKKVNEYRIENGLSAWMWDDKVFVIAEKHNTYQVKISDISHEELQDVENHIEVSRLGSRFDSVGLKWWNTGENVAVVNSLDLSLEEIATNTLDMWINSPPHHKALLSKKYKAGALSSHRSTEWVESRYAHSNSWVYVTLNIYNDSLNKRNRKKRK
jgi:uncharacterized protein YkwD